MSEDGGRQPPDASGGREEEDGRDGDAVSGQAAPDRDAASTQGRRERGDEAAEVIDLSEDEHEQAGEHAEQRREQSTGARAKRGPGRPKTSDVWDHFEVLDDNPSKAQCKHCDVQV